MTDGQRKFWLDDEVDYVRKNSFVWGIVYGILSTLIVTIAYEYQTGYPIYDLLLRILEDNSA
jgi:hypothetical protein